MKFVQDKNSKLLELDMKLTEDVSFKPKVNKLDEKMEQRVQHLRQNYDLAKEHSKTPIKKANREKAVQEAAEAQRKVKEFLERNNAMHANKEKRKQKLKEELEQIERDFYSKGQYQSNKNTEHILKDSDKFKGKSMLERQAEFLKLKKQKLQEKAKEKEEKEFVENIRFHKVTDKKKPPSRKNKPLDQSAKTANNQTRNNQSDLSATPLDDRSRSTVTDKKKRDGLESGKNSSHKKVEDFSKILLPGEGAQDGLVVVLKAAAG